MSVGKYSPTVSSSYAADRMWWVKNGGGTDNGANPDRDEDDDGYDRYGYSENGDGPDRAGYDESDYLTSYDYNDDTGEIYFGLVISVQDDWNGKLAAGIKHEDMA